MYHVARFALITLLVTVWATDADARRRRGKGKKGAVVVECSITGAIVTLGSKTLGKTPLRQQAVSAGKHKIMVKKLGHLDFSQDIEVKPGKTVKVFADLLPFAGVIKVTSNTKADVTVDGKNIGQTPIEYEVKLGKRSVTVSAPGYESFTKTVRADPGNTYNIKAKLKKSKAAPVEAPSDDLDLAALPLELPADDGGGGGDDLALMPLAPPPDDGGAGGGGDDLSLEALPDLALEAPADSGEAGELDLMALPGLAAPPDDGGGLDLVMPPGASVQETVDEETPWYFEWWAITAAAAIVVGVGVGVAVGATSGGDDQADTLTGTAWAPGVFKEENTTFPAIINF